MRKYLYKNGEHRLENEGKNSSSFNRSTSGWYTGEDDIVRIDDDF